MSDSCFVINKKPFMYKLGARLFKWLVLSNKVCEMERYAKVLETNKLQMKGSNFKWVWEDDVNEKA